MMQIFPLSTDSWDLNYKAPRVAKAVYVVLLTVPECLN